MNISLRRLLTVLAIVYVIGGCRPSGTGPEADRESRLADSQRASSPSGDQASSSNSSELSELAQQIQARIAELGSGAKSTIQEGKLTEIVVQDGSTLTAEDIALFGQQTDLTKLQIFNFRSLDDAMVATLSGLPNLRSLALTNSVINDSSIELIAKSFPKLTDLDLSSNTNLTRGVMKHIASLTGLRSLTLYQNNFNDISTRRLKDLTQLRALDLRGNMEAGNMTLGVVGKLPKLTAFKHRSTAVTDEGVESLASGSGSLQNLLIQDFMITSASGEHLAKLKQLKQLEIFRCQGLGSVGVVALKGLNLDRLTLRDLPAVDDVAMEVFTQLPALKRLYLHEMSGVTDTGLAKLSSVQSLELLDVWNLPKFTDASIEVLAGLPNLKELSLRETGITDAAIDKLASLPKLHTLVLKENGNVSDEALKRLSTKQWTKLDIGK